MKLLTRDISLTLIVKLLLLFLLWWFCVRTMHPTLETKEAWLLGSKKQALSSQPIKGDINDSSK
ncbi:cytochrome oxidase putative small subunit CydP [Legionella sp. km772]|uniref:cytochrome oxidase putative small subunit CydP n=1 Tax=Legionella sp. km772 TaxID=2498111 RepID=UPI000F8ED26E|nr:hypothetical protein ELY15_03305 [Legionella sp. km772]